MKLSVLDQSTAATGKPEDQAVRDTIELAQACEALGYNRFWVSEHHNHPTIVGTAPEIVMAAAAQNADPSAEKGPGVPRRWLVTAPSRFALVARGYLRCLRIHAALQR